MISKNYLFILMGLCLVAGIFIAGCTQQSTPAQTTTVVPTTPAVQSGMANPASVYCGQTGGTTEIKKNADGSEYGMCNFANGTSCEEWALFRGEGCTSEVAVTTTVAGQTSIANPASVYCGQTGGTTEIKKNADGSEYGMCNFANGTSCEEWALFRGEGCKTGTSTP